MEHKFYDLMLEEGKYVVKSSLPTHDTEDETAPHHRTFYVVYGTMQRVTVDDTKNDTRASTLKILLCFVAIHEGYLAEHDVTRKCPTRVPRSDILGNGLSVVPH
jgi:hypothetical protein